MDAAFDEGLQRRQVILNDIPDHIDVSRLTGMAQPVAEIDHLLPLDIRRVPPPRRSLRGIARTHFISGEQVKAAARRGEAEGRCPGKLPGHLA
jgi:hypothetical protein